MENNPQSIDISTNAEVVKNLVDKLRAYYVFPDIAEEICVRLKSHLKKGNYTKINEGQALANMLTQQIQEVNQDQHLIVQWHPESLPDQEGPMIQNQDWLNQKRQMAKFENYGIHKAERLPGNVGFLEILEFHSVTWAGDTAIAAMNFLANSDILIIDLRKCRGGDPDMIALISSYLFGEERVHLNSLYWRAEDVTEQYWTQPYVPGKRFGEKPVFVLISHDTFSGGEEFSYNLKVRQRATLVGESTKGGAHPGTTYRLHTHFDVFIPNGRAINPVTGTNWEGTGVTPDVSVPHEQAFKVAYGMALKSLIENQHVESSGSFTLITEEVQEALNNL